jgi:alkylated DNA repair dioxygenase AlkB
MANNEDTQDEPSSSTVDDVKLTASLSSPLDASTLPIPAPELIDDNASNLHLSIYKNFGTCHPSLSRFSGLILQHTKWRRVKYKSARYQNDCTTPCYTEFYGGVSSKAPNPYTPVPDYLQPLVALVSELCNTPFNAVLVRLYFDGADNIAWHTDGRKFLGPTPTIASLSFGGAADFEMRRMTDVWPCTATPDGGIDKNAPPRTFRCDSGDMLVMRGDTQDHWHHRVPAVKSRKPRLNLNFRYILPNTGAVATEGQATYYKYMVYGDHDEAWRAGTLDGWSYDELMKKHGSLLNTIVASDKPNDPSSLFKTNSKAATIAAVPAKKKKKRNIMDMFASVAPTSSPSSKSSKKPAADTIIAEEAPPPTPPQKSRFVETMVEMGFSADAARVALDLHNGDEDSALNQLLSY